MEHTMSQNPLTQYFRQFKLYMKLPSGTLYYPPDLISFTDKGEVGVFPMTGRDELALKNPDGLLNGESLIEVLKSCVPAIKNPRLLLTNDIDALITAIRYATFNDSLETNLKCPECATENTFKLDLQYALDNMESLEPEYVVNLDSGVSVFVKPYAFPEMLKGLHTQFEQNKLTRAAESTTLTDEQRAEIYGKSFKQLSILTFELMVDSVIKVVDESRNINVTDKAFIKEFLFNIDKISVNEVADLIQKINAIGVKKSFTAKCSSCAHEWESEIDFNPVNFS